MQVEKILMKIIPSLVSKVDKNKLGYCIEIGVGTDNFFFDKLSKIKFKVVAIDPLPTEDVLQLAKNNNVEFCLSRCISAQPDSFPVPDSALPQGRPGQRDSGLSGGAQGPSGSHPAPGRRRASLCLFGHHPARFYLYHFLPAAVAAGNY